MGIKTHTTHSNTPLGDVSAVFLFSTILMMHVCMISPKREDRAGHVTRIVDMYGYIIKEMNQG